MLTQGVFIPTAPCRGSRGRVKLNKVPALREEWSPARNLHEVSGLIMHELGDITKWETHLTKDERKMLPVLHASCSPSTLPQTLAVQDWIPTALSKLGRQWRGIRVGGSKHRLQAGLQHRLP